MTTVNQILEIAQAEIGYSEKPPGTNLTKYGEWYGQNGQAWCAQFVSWVFARAGMSLEITTGKGFSYCPYGVQWFIKQNRWHKSNPRAGDIVFYDWYPGTAKSGAWHVGIVQHVYQDGSIEAIEGNTSTTNQGNGGQVMRRYRHHSLILGFGRPDYTPEAEAMPLISVETDAGKSKALPLVNGKTVFSYEDLIALGLITGGQFKAQSPLNKLILHVPKNG